jgi:hypothetical protein
VLAVLFTLGSLGCARPRSGPQRRKTPAGAATTDPLSATLAGKSEIVLRWKPPAPEVAGAWVEFGTPGADFVKLEAVWPAQTTFRHGELAPGTTFLYRLVPFIGHPSAIAAVRSGGEPPGAALQAEGPLDEPGPARPPAAQRALRSPATLADAAPADLRVSLSAPTTAELRWTDRASDEDGYLVELARGPGDFQICALLPPNTTSFRKVALPPRTELRFRVRAFADGPPSNQASATTKN